MVKDPSSIHMIDPSLHKRHMERFHLEKLRVLPTIEESLLQPSMPEELKQYLISLDTTLYESLPELTIRPMWVRHPCH
jgi:hypothetical protein